jgi:hypothetical protein
VPRELVETPGERLDPRRWVLQERNAAIRREAVRKIGIERVCRELGATVLATGQDHAGQLCELLALDLGDGRQRPYLKLRNPSIGVYHLEGVPPEIQDIPAALAWRNQTDQAPAWLA